MINDLFSLILIKKILQGFVKKMKMNLFMLIVELWIKSNEEQNIRVNKHQKQTLLNVIKETEDIILYSSSFFTVSIISSLFYSSFFSVSFASSLFFLLFFL